MALTPTSHLQAIARQSLWRSNTTVNTTELVVEVENAAHSKEGELQAHVAR